MSNTGYSTLEDAWGIKPHTKRSRRAKKKMASAVAPAPDMADPICDLYDAKFRRKRRSRGAGFDPWDSQASIHHPFSMISDATDSVEAEPEGFEEVSDHVVEQQVSEPEPITIKRKARSVAPRDNENHDLFMYVFSGVLLLFVLEQFIQVGLHIGVRNMEP